MSSKNVPNNLRSPHRRARHWSISRRLTVLYAASSFLMLVLATAYLYWSLVGNLDREDNATTDKARERWLHDLAAAGLATFDAVWEP